jgi:hypothetical protein
MGILGLVVLFMTALIVYTLASTVSQRHLKRKEKMKKKKIIMKGEVLAGMQQLV